MTNWTWTKAKTRVVNRPWWKILGVRTTKLPGTTRRLRIFYFGWWTLAFIEGYVPSEAEEAEERMGYPYEEPSPTNEHVAFFENPIATSDPARDMGTVRADVGDGPKDYDPRRFPAG